MKISAKISALALAVVMLFAFAGCGAKSPEENIKGEWAGEVSLAKVMEASGATDVSAFEDVDNVVINLEFDGKEFTMKVDARDVVESDSFKEALGKFLLASSGMTEEDVEATGMSVDDIIDQSVDAMSEQLNVEKTAEYEFKEEKLYMDGSEQKFEFDGDNTLILDLEGFGEIEFERK